MMMAWNLVLGGSYGPVDQPVQDLRQRALQEKLGDDEYRRLVGEGRRLTLDDGIELALDALDQPSS